MRRSSKYSPDTSSAGPVSKLVRRLPRISGWDWLIGIIVTIALVAASIQIGQGVYTKAKSVLAQLLLDQAWAATLDSNTAIRPWAGIDTWPVARIEIPRLERSAIVLAGASGQALAFGPALLSNSALPGERGTSVLAGHRDTHFAFMSELVEGDRIDITNVAGQKFTYEISAFRVAPWNASGLDADTPDTRLALVTCWPLDGTEPGPLRYIAEAGLIASTPAASR